jgi:phage terminase large subunit GpA-like protein
MPGLWRTDVAPFLREIMDCLSPDSGVELTVVMKPVQVGATEVLLNTAAYYLAHAPSTVMVVQPNQDMAKRLSRQRVEPMIELCAPLKGLIATRRSQGGNEAFLKVSRTGGTLVIASARSAAGLRSLPARVVLCDEVDSYLTDLGEGSPFDLAAARATTFGSQKRVAAISTPTYAGQSLIERLYNESDQRKWFVPCPSCGFEQTLEWENLRWEPGEPEIVRYRCAQCNGEIPESQKAAMVAAGRWKPTGVTRCDSTRGYAFNALVSPWLRWSELVRQFEAAVTPEAKKSFTNLVLALPWQDEAEEVPEAAALSLRAEPFAAEVPASAALLTAGADLQHDRIEVEVVGWGKGFESWSVAYVTLYGDPVQPELWQQLDELLMREFRHESGMPLRISAACIDSGYLPDEVLRFTRERFGRRVYAIKSLSSAFGKPVWPRKAVYNRKAMPLFLISADEAKRWFFQRLKIAAPGAGYCHFPMGRPMDFFRMLVAERLITRRHHGREHREWSNIKRERNEGLDARCYNVAALHSLLMGGLNLDAHVAAFEKLLAPPQLAAIAANLPEQPKPNGAPAVIRSKWMDF